MDYIAQNLSQSLIVAGIALLIIEVAILGFATFVLFFMGCSMVITGLLMLFGILDATYITAFWSNAVVTGILAALLWQPLKRSQQSSGADKETPTTISHQFVLEHDVDSQGSTHHKYSGIKWKVKSQQPLVKGTMVKVVKADVGALWVEEV
jgi:membrane protein implicated in regulation of membrane protease activity